jgi:hypothetical protein
MRTFMACGHSSNAVTENGKPICAICAGINPGASVQVERVSLKGRVARCPDCGSERESDYDLPFFEHRHDMAKDSFYNGCRGWN